MPWQPAYNAFGTEPLIRQLLAIVNRDIQAALDFVSGEPGSLRPFANYQLAESSALNFPAIMMMPVRSPFDPAQQNLVRENISIFCAVAVDDDDPNRVAIKIQQYVMAVWHVLTAAYEKTSSDFLLANLPLPASAYPGGQVTDGLAPGALKRLFVQQNEFAELRQVKSIFVKAASLSIEAELYEA